MKYILDIKVSAKFGVLDGFDYYESKQQGLGEKFIDAWEQHIDIIKHEPLLFQKKHKEYRQALIKPYPYHIIYEVEGNLITVYKVIYAGKSSGMRYNKR